MYEIRRLSNVAAPLDFINDISITSYIRLNTKITTEEHLSTYNKIYIIIFCGVFCKYVNVNRRHLFDVFIKNTTKNRIILQLQWNFHIST